MIDPAKQRSAPASAEAARIQLLVERDGREAARAWVRRTLQIYRSTLANPASFAAVGPYRQRFEASVAAFEAWLGD